MDETAAARVTGVAQVSNLHALKVFAPDKRLRRVIMFLKVNPRILSAKADG
ncbi:MAG TPA: hypothetical protein VLK35_19740 [Methylomirabilota bacterium]|nr:hypothetical protein [Methylomirabilota bacterium]